MPVKPGADDMIGIPLLLPRRSEGQARVKFAAGWLQKAEGRGELPAPFAPAFLLIARSVQ